RDGYEGRPAAGRGQAVQCAGRQRMRVGFRKELRGGLEELRLVMHHEAVQLLTIVRQWLAGVTAAELPLKAECQRHQVDHRQVSIDRIHTAEQALELLE